MNKKRLSILTVLSVLSFAAAASAQDAPAAPAASDSGPAMERADGKGPMRALRGDTDGDGVVSKAEWQTESEARFAEIDADKDGKITRDELKSHREAKRAEFKAKHEAWKAAHPGFAKEKPAEVPPAPASGNDVPKE